MNLRPASPRSLRGRLLRLLWWPLLVVLVLSAAYDYRSALNRARDNQDLALRRVAIALATRLDVDADDARNDDLGLHLSRTVQAMQRVDGQDRLYALVLDEHGGVISGDPAQAALVERDERDRPRYTDRRWDHHDVRVISFPHPSALGPVMVVVAETTERRQAQTRQVLLGTLMPNLVLLGLTLALVWLGVDAAMRPLDRLSEAVGQRSPDDLGALPEATLPAELRPLVAALNRLMSHVRAAAQAQQAFLSQAAHQLRTPLAGVQTQVELIGKEATPEQRSRLAAVTGALQRMARSTQQMLALARSAPEAAVPEAFHRVDLRDLLEDDASIWLDPALQAGIDLGFDAASAPVQGSAWMLHELIGNLVHNAIRHAPAGGRVTASCGVAQGGGAWLVVEDDGPGIPAEERERVLQRFYQAPGAARGGSGLDLAIVREVALRHGATLALGETGPAGGLRVRLEFPPLHD